MQLEVHTDAHAASQAGAHSFVTRAAEAVAARGRFAVALSGGTAPRVMYSWLAREPFVSAVQWEGVHLFWGDERCVPPRHPRSNFGMANAAFISRVPIPPANVHRMRGELPPEDGAAVYREELVRFFGGGMPIFDLVHLGLGPDAHTCSLFPFDPLLGEREKAVGVALHRPLGEWRIPLTPPVVKAARRVEMLVLGQEKAKVVRRVMEGPLDPLRLPAQLVRSVDGEMAWLLDEPAASEL